MGPVALALPAAVALLLARAGARWARIGALPAPRRHGAVFGLVAVAALGVLLVEALSAVRLVTPTACAGGWALLLLAVCAVARRGGAAIPPPAPPPRDRRAAVLGAIVAAVLLLTLVVALAAPPNTYDSMTYHMSRVMHWAQRATLAPYPTCIVRQVLYTPGAELALLQLELLSGGDRLANLVQWTSFVGVVLAASALAASAGADRLGQAFAALIAATTPMAILQASSTQNDLVTAFLVVALAGWIAAWRRRPALWLAAAIGATLGLALLTKITAYVVVLPLLAWLAADLRRRGRQGLHAAALIAGLALLLNAGFLARQAGVWWRVATAAEAGGALDLGARTYLNAAMSPALLASNLARNLALHVPVPGAALRARLDATMARAHAALGLDPADARTTFPAGRAFRFPGLERHEDLAPNPLHLALLLTAAALLVARRATRRAAGLAATLLVLAGSAFVLFALVFKWQPWHSRLHLPVFMLAAPAVAAALVADARGRRLLLPLAGVLALASLPYLLANASRPLLGPHGVLRAPRRAQYFANQPALEAPYAAAAARVRERRCRDVGLVLGSDDWEYPLWVLLRDDGGAPPRLRHLCRTLNTEPEPIGDACAVVAVGVTDERVRRLLGERFAPALEADRLRLWLPAR